MNRYLPDTICDMVISQFEKRENRYIIDIYNRIIIFSENGAHINDININGLFVIDSKNNIIVLKHVGNLLFYFDFNGDLFKSVYLKPPKSDRSSFKHIKIVLLDKLHFAH